MNLKGLLAASVGAIVLASGIAQAQIKLEQQKQKLPAEVAERFRDIDLTRNVTGPGAEGASSWVSPLLLNHPGTIGGQRYSINGERYLYEFGFTIINPDKTNSAESGVDCFNADGSRNQEYATRFNIAPMNATAWRSDSVVPAPTTDGRADEHRVWCNVWANRPIFVFGERFTEVGSKRSVDGFNLLVGAR